MVSHLVSYKKIMEKRYFQKTEKIPLRAGFTISKRAGLGGMNRATWFSLGSGTSISQERYDRDTLYLGSFGTGTFLLGAQQKQLDMGKDSLLLVPAGNLCGVETRQGFIYMEINLEKEAAMNEQVKPGEVLKLREMISYEEGSIVNLDLIRNKNLKYVLMAFDEGTGLDPHRAPGDALLTVLEGKAVIVYEGTEYPMQAGESFRFDKNGLHSVKADGRFKMSLLLVLE